ncbi:MAG: IS200/IS605 family accessory protein TnpB-related protein, partial [Microcystis panniformis]
QGLTLKRNCQVDYYLHTASKYIIDKLLAHQINLLVIGHNQGWKQNINIGDRNNQSFVNIPHSRFIEQLTYKANLGLFSTLCDNFCLWNREMLTRQHF